MGTVYAALDEQLGERVALKVMSGERIDERVLERFRREVRLARKVSSSFVARMHDIGVHEGVWYLTMQLISGENLREHIAWFAASDHGGGSERAARESVARALRVAGDYAETHLAAGMLAAQSGAYAEAASELATALDIAPTCADAK